MLPAITPPTDNLYKFLSLFGLTIFLFAGYNLGIVWDRITSNTMQIEDIKITVLKKVKQMEHFGDHYLADDVTFYRFCVNSMDNDLHLLERQVIDARLLPITKIELLGKMKKLDVELQSLYYKRLFSIMAIVLGVVLMFRGFRLWNKREQKLRDRMLVIELAMKEREQQLLTAQAAVASPNPEQVN